MKRSLTVVLLLISLAVSVSASPAFEGIVTYTDTQAGFTIEYPVQATLTAGLDAALGYRTVFINFAADSGGEFAGVIITAFDNPARLPIDASARERFGLRPDAPGLVRGEWIGGMPALLANRPSPLAGEDAAVALIEGDGVIIRIGLPNGGGGVDGPTEPPAQHYDWFNRIVHSIRRVPREQPQAQIAAVDPNAEPATAVTFQMPFSVPVTTLYGEQYGVAISNTAFGVRNLGLEHRRTCFGVDWPRLLHAGVDWFRADGQYATPTDVLAVADGVVAWYDPAYNSYPGKVVIVRHRLADGRDLYSMYAHLGPDVSIVPGQVVVRGQRIGSMLYQGGNTHLHFELRYFLDGRNIYGAYAACNSTTLYAGRGYTYRTYPDNFPTAGAGYVDPVAFIAANGGATPPIAVASVVTSTLRVAGPQPALAYKGGAPALIDAPLGLPGSAPLEPARDSMISLTMTAAFTPTTALYLPLIAREYPRREPACVEGQQLLVNTGFEDGPSSAPWVQSSNGASDLIQEDRPYAGAYGLWLGGRDLADEEALQSFVLPYYTEGITLTFQRYVTTAETDPVPYDVLEVVVENAAGVEVTPRFVLDNAAVQKDQWVAETIVLTGMGSLGGQRLQLSLKMATDGSLVTSGFVDEVGMAVRCEAR
jgi:murein DD-endopeptidase MepM/ murein hydrolase activator NlpD